MDWVSISRNVKEYVGKYHYVIVVLAVGLVLMALPQTAQDRESPVPETAAAEEEDLQTALEELLSHLEGAGKVKVLLSQSAGERIVYQTDEDTDTDENSRSLRRETVIVSDAQRGESGLIQQTLPPVYLGAVVLCQGADSAAVRLSIIEAVSSVTGLASHNIAVLKMK